MEFATADDGTGQAASDGARLPVVEPGSESELAACD